MSEHVTEVSDSNFEKDVLQSEQARAGRFLGGVVCAVPHACADGRSRGGKVCRATRASSS